MLLYTLYPVAGALAGLLAGLLGVGGGVVVIPIMVFLFSAQGFPYEHIMHTALGTSLATIMLTSLSSLRAHHRRGAVHWDTVKRITPGIILGTFSGSWLAAGLSPTVLRAIFACFLFFVAAQMLMNFMPKSTRRVPKAAGMFGVGGFIGLVSSMVGIGGGTLSVPFMTWCHLPVHRAIGTSAAIGFPIAVAGTLGYIATGLSVSGLPAQNFGFINLPALAGIALFSMLTAPAGARLAHRLPVPSIKRVFAVFLVSMAVRMIWSLF
jgi:uncharacterized membrane protein YfcA